MYCIMNIMRMEGRDITLITLSNRNNVQLKLMNFGAAVVELIAPDREGNLENIVLTYENIEDYMENIPRFGVTVGRTSGRIGGGSFRLEDKKYELCRNDGVNHLHGGPAGFSFRIWDYSISEGDNGSRVEFTYLSRDMEEGYPGNLEAKVIYTLTEDNEVIMEYQAKSDRDTLCNLTNHSYFNLSGNYKRKVTGQLLKIKSDYFLETAADMVPTGRLLAVVNTPMDFNVPKPVGRDIESDYGPIRQAGGYDHPWMLAGSEEQVELYDESSGRKMTISTTYPCVVVYTYNFADNEKLRYDITGSKYDGICFETQYEPDGINYQNLNPSILKAGGRYRERTVFRLEVL